jgi:hypothetical protein
VEDQQKYKEWLLGICNNAREKESKCEADFNKATTTPDGLWDFYNTYMMYGESMYEYFFQLQVVRPDVSWTEKDTNLLTIPFVNPKDEAIRKFLEVNIEDEWKWQDWHLRLNFLNFDDDTMTHVVFQPGATPHVNALGGSEITMDDNSPLSEYDVQWTIRHEFGHVLGFPDCYVEFYDADRDVMVSYQLDLDNLMCSRRGHFRQTHFDELKRNYFNKKK